MPVDEREEVGKGEDEKVADSAISFGDNGELRDDALDLKAQEELPQMPVESAPDVWAAEESTEATTTSPAIESDRSVSPDLVPGPAVGATDRSEAGRQPSKVQELVEMYDGIARKGVSSSEPSVSATKQSPLTITAHDDAEPEVPDIEATKVQREEVAEAVLKVLAEDRTNEERSHVIEVVNGPERTAMSDDHQDDATPQTKPTSPEIPYPIDLSLLDNLFPSTPAMSIEPELVPDIIIDDSFKTTSERKAWYHVSRSGSIRQHNSGDVEDYVRIRWASSQVREQTLKIVRRWMEEDSIGGRVVLGRRLGMGGASMFNWDSEAPPVEIGELLKKKSSTHSKQLSGDVKNSEPAFGWSNNLPASPPLEAMPAPAEALPEASSFNDIGQLVSDTPVSLKLPMPPKVVPTTATSQTTSALPKTFAAPETSSNGADVEDDDDWGEMVSSPTAAASSFGMAPEGADPTSGNADHQLSPDDALDAAKDMSATHHTTADGHNDWGHDSDSSAISDVKIPLKPKGTHSPSPLQPVPTHPTKPATGAPSPLAPTSNISNETPRGITRTASEPRTSQDEVVVATILRDLPNLSYMMH